MVLNLQSSTSTLPKDLEAKLNINPFSDTAVPEDVAAYNQGQLLDAIFKNLDNQPLNQEVPIDSERYRELGSPQQAISEQQALDSLKEISQDTTNTFTDPTAFEELSIMNLIELQKQDPKAFNEAKKRYMNGIRGSIDTPGSLSELNVQGQSFIPDLSSTRSVNETLNTARRFERLMADKGIPDVLVPFDRKKERLATADKLDKKREAEKNGYKNNRTMTSAWLSDEVNSLERAMTNPVEKSFFTEVANGNTLQTNLELVEADLGIDSSNRKYFSSVTTLALANFSDVIKKHRHEEQIIGEYFGIPTNEIETDNTIDSTDTIKKKGRFANASFFKPVEKPTNTKQSKQESLDLLAKGFAGRNKEPILNGMMVTLDKFIRSTMNPNKAPSSLPSKSLKGAGSILRYWTETGKMSWGRTKKGYLTPVVYDNFGITNLGEGELATAFDPSLRKFYARPNAPTYPAVDIISDLEKGDWQRFAKGKDLEGRSTISKTYMNFINRNPLTINGDNLFVIEKLNEEVQEDFSLPTTVGGSSHPFAETLGELGTKSHEIYSREDQKALLEQQEQGQTGVNRPQAGEIINKTNVTINERIKRVKGVYADQIKNNNKYYPKLSKSGPTGRYNIFDSVFNFINDKGVIRPLLNIGHKTPISINNTMSKNPQEVLNLANSIFKPSGGIINGVGINARLQNLRPMERQMLGFYYALGKTADKYNVRKMRVVNNEDRTPIQAIENGIAAFDAMANQGDKFLSYLPSNSNPEGNFPKLNSMNDLEKKIFSNNKGEWGYPYSITMNAAKLRNARKNNETEFTFTFTFEEDARQSNAALISLLIGDYQLAGLLGILPEFAQEKTNPITGDRVPAADLRDLLTSTIGSSVSRVLNNINDPAEKQRAVSLTTYFEDVMNDTGLDGNKVITRGLIVAGLYGKFPGRMFTEAEDMLNKTLTHSSSLEKAYIQGNEINRDAMLRDISAIYLNLAQEHMANAMGYQSLMKSIGKVMGILDGPTEINGIYPGEKVLLSIEELYPTVQADKVADTITQLTEDVGGFTFPIFERATKSISSSPNVRSQRALRAATDIAQRRREANLAGQELEETVPLAGDPRTAEYDELGSQVSRALPVSIIQNMDSIALALTFLIANGNSKLPPEAVGIHDAIISTADSILLMNNAYNNIVPQTLAQGGRNFFENLESVLLVDTIDPLLDIKDNEKVNIGTDIVLIEGSNKLAQYSGVTNYFDEIAAKLKQDNFFSPEEKKRKRTYGNQIIEDQTNEQFSKLQNESAAKFLEAAAQAGYIPPPPVGNANDRKSYSVTGKQFKTLVLLMLEREGLLNEDIAAVFSSEPFNIKNVSNLNDEDYKKFAFRNGRRMTKMMNNLKSNAKLFAKSTTYNRQLD